MTAIDKQKLKGDIFLIGILLLVAVISIIVVATRRVKTNLYAKIYVQANVVEVIDLSKNEEKDLIISGLNGNVHIHAHNGAIAIVESNCPHQDCVRMGYVNESGRPIICAYNAVYVVIDGESAYDVVI